MKFATKNYQGKVFNFFSEINKVEGEIKFIHRTFLVTFKYFAGQ